MAFEIIKTTVNRLTVKVSCGCNVMREFEEWNYKTPLGEVKFFACQKHEEDGSTIEFILSEYMDTEIQRVQNSAPQHVGPDPQLDEHGQPTRKVLSGPGKRQANPNKPKLSSAALTPHIPQVEVGSGQALDAMIAQDGATPAPELVKSGTTIDAIIDGTDEADESETILPTSD